MITREKVKKEIDRLSDAEVEKVYLYLSSIAEKKKGQTKIRSLKLNGKLDLENVRSVAHG